MSKFLEFLEERPELFYGLEDYIKDAFLSQKKNDISFETASGEIMFKLNWSSTKEGGNFWNWVHNTCNRNELIHIPIEKITKELEERGTLLW